MRVLITGGSGFIGSGLVSSWQAREDVAQIYVLSRSPARFAGNRQKVTLLENLDVFDETAQIDAIINLAGEPIIDKRWNDERKKLLYQSRLQTTDNLLKLIRRLKAKPHTLISGSAVGFYGNQPDSRTLTENDEGRPCFSHKLCHDWEQKALEAEREGLRVCLIRTGIVLGNGGALSRMLLPFKLGLGGPIGSGQQWMSWVDLDDEVAAINFLLDHQTLSGIFNLTAPEPVTNTEFARTLAKVLKRPAFLRTPALAMYLMLGEGAELLLEGQRVLPTNLEQAGFQFAYPALEKSLRHWLTND